MERASVIAEPGSAYVLSGPARSEWEHSIPPVDQLRYSITFREIADREVLDKLCFLMMGVLRIALPRCCSLLRDAERSAADRDAATFPPFSPALWAAG